MSVPQPRAPFGRWPLQLYAEGVGHVWYTAPATFVNQLDVAYATVETAERLHDAIDHVLQREREDIEEHGGLLIIHDWRLLSGYEKEARKVFLDRMRRREPGYLRGAVAVVRDTPLLRMAVQTANLVMALRTGGQLELATDPTASLLAHDVRKPEPGWR